MDVTILRLTMALELAILSGLFWRGFYRIIPCFAFTILCCLIEPFPAMQIYRHGTPAEYYRVYYAMDLFNVALYLICIWECWWRGRFMTISISMGVYLVPKAISYFLLAIHRTEAATALHGSLRFANLACYAVWCFMVWEPLHVLEDKVP